MNTHEPNKTIQNTRTLSKWLYPMIRVLKCFLKHATKSKLAGERNKLGFGAKVWKAESPLVFR